MSAREKRPWSGRFSKPVDETAEEFGASLPVDERLWEHDIKGSIAHVRMLASRGIVTAEEADTIERGLTALHREMREGSFEFHVSDEDIHMAVERALIAKVGPVGGKLHTARSRNDQVATDARLWAKGAAAGLVESLDGVLTVIVSLAEEHPDAVMPGYTHLQKAQPVLFAHHMLAYFWMLSRDAERIRHAHLSADVSPLGAAALAGTTFPIDRQATAEALGFSSVAPNSIDAVSDRDFLLDLVYASAVAMVHLSRLCEELVLWATEEFGFITMDDSHSTGSSIMPQKRNPDFAELVRGKTGRVVGDLTALLVTMKALPLAYDKDMQEDKEAAFDAVDTLVSSLRAVEGMLSTMRVNADRMQAAARGGHMAATDLADHLAGRGVPFRDAHGIVGTLVARCEAEGRTLQDLSAEELAAASPEFGPEALELIDVRSLVDRRDTEGGTSCRAVAEQLARAKATLAADEGWLRNLLY